MKESRFKNFSRVGKMGRKPTRKDFKGFNVKHSILGEKKNQLYKFKMRRPNLAVELRGKKKKKLKCVGNSNPKKRPTM